MQYIDIEQVKRFPFSSMCHWCWVSLLDWMRNKFYALNCMYTQSPFSARKKRVSENVVLKHAPEFECVSMKNGITCFEFSLIPISSLRFFFFLPRQQSRHRNVRKSRRKQKDEENNRGKKNIINQLTKNEKDKKRRSILSTGRFHSIAHLKLFV